MVQFVLRLHEAQADWEDRVFTQLLQSPVMFVDETGLTVDRKNHWIHVIRCWITMCFFVTTQ